MAGVGCGMFVTHYASKKSDDASWKKMAQPGILMMFQLDLIVAKYLSEALEMLTQCAMDVHHFPVLASMLQQSPILFAA